jgi:hypothetical protein
MYTDEDRRRLLESRHDIGAAEKSALLSADTKMQTAVDASRDALGAARAALHSAAAVSDRERSETDAERAKLEQAIASLVRRYGFVRGKIHDTLLNVDPDAPLPAAELERRQKLVTRVFRAAQSDLERMGQGSIIELVGSAVDALEKEPDLAPLGFQTPLSASLDAAKSAAKELKRETGEDAQAMTALRAARDGFDRAQRAHALLVESILVRESREEELGRFVLAKDPAYAARRAARAPIGDEPGANEDSAAPPPAQGG